MARERLDVVQGLELADVNAGSAAICAHHDRHWPPAGVPAEQAASGSLTAGHAAPKSRTNVSSVTGSSSASTPTRGSRRIRTAHGQRPAAPRPQQLAAAQPDGLASTCGSRSHGPEKVGRGVPPAVRAAGPCWAGDRRCCSIQPRRGRARTGRRGLRPPQAHGLDQRGGRRGAARLDDGQRRPAAGLGHRRVSFLRLDVDGGVAARRRRVCLALPAREPDPGLRGRRPAHRRRGQPRRRRRRAVRGEPRPPVR